MEEIVWTSDQKRSRVREAVVMIAALQYHYRRMFLGAQHGMR